MKQFAEDEECDIQHWEVSKDHSMVKDVSNVHRSSQELGSGFGLVPHTQKKDLHNGQLGQLGQMQMYEMSGTHYNSIDTNQNTSNLK